MGSPLTSKRNAFRKISKDKPGTLLTAGLEEFKEDLVHIHDHGDEDSPLQPIMVAWFRSIFLPANRNENDLDCKEGQTYCSLIIYGLNRD